MQQNPETPKNFLTERQRFIILLFVFPLAFALGSIGYWRYNAEEGFAGALTAMYHSLQLFILHAPHFERPLPLPLELGRWLALITTVMAVVDIAIHILHNEKMEWKRNRKKNHVIVCGLGTRGMDMVLKLHGLKQDVIAIEKSPLPDGIEHLNRLGIPLVCGDASDTEILKLARIEYAKEIYAFGPGDTINLYIATAASTIKTKNSTPRKCTIFIGDAELRNALQGNNQQLTDNASQIIHFVEPFGPEANTLLTDALPLDHDGIGPDDPRSVHLVILGFGIMGRTIAVKAAQLGRFANRKTLQISVIDRFATLHHDSLLFHHPFIEEVANLRFYMQEVLSPETRSMISKWGAEKDVLLNVVICFDNPSLAFDVVFNMLPELNKSNIRVGVRLHESESFNFMLLGAIDHYKQLNICVFGIDSNFGEFTGTAHSDTEDFARDVHQAYIKVVEKNTANDPVKREEMANSGELTPWESLGEDFRESNRQQAIHMKFKIRACGFEIAQKDDPREAVQQIEEPARTALAIMEHDRWVAERKVNNWTHDSSSDKRRRISKYLIDWAELPPSIRQFDYDTVENIPNYLDLMGKKLVRREPKDDLTS